MSFFLYYLEKGGSINIMIFFVCLVIMYIGVGKLFFFHSLRNIRDLTQLSQKIAGEAALNLSDNCGHEGTLSPNTLREILLMCVPHLEKGLDTMAAWIAVAPLLGLLGTVAGMIETFSIIMQFGVGNPGMLSQGISVALLTTQAGLLVSFPGLIFHNFLRSQKEDLLQRLIYESEKKLPVGGKCKL